jgi:Secretion system C-terminal sorting domain
VNDQLNIEFSLNDASFVNIEVYDFTGRKFEEMLTENLSAGNNKILLNVSKLNGGIYMLRLKTNIGTVTTSFTKQQK